MRRIPYIAASNRRRADSAKLDSRQAGFTIVELMIATLVFSVVLLVITIGVLHFTNSYYKGINSSTTQSTAQSVVDTVSQAIQFSAAAPTATDGTQGFFCAGNKLFLYQLGTVYTGDLSKSIGLYEMNSGPGNCATATPSGGTELLGRNMRLTSIAVSESNPAANLWQVSLGIAYGDSDLLCNTSLNGNAGGCQKGDQTNSAEPGTIVKGGDVTCKVQDGSQFCSMVTLSAVAQQRLAGN